MSQWPVNKVFFWERAPFFRALVPFAIGILGYYLLPSLRLYLATASAITLLSVIVATFILIRHLPGIFISAMIALLMLGYCIAGYNDIRSRYNWMGYNMEPDAVYLARITTVPEEKDHSWKLTVRVISRTDSSGTIPTPGNAFVYLGKTEMPSFLRRGDSILLPGHWEPIRDAGNPLEFSYASYCARNNIFHRQRCHLSEIRLFAAANTGTAPLTDRVHDWCMQRLDRFLGQHKARGLLQSMLMGDEINLDPELRQSYSETGIVHIIAISGGNVVIFFIVISTLLSWLRHKRYIWVKYVVALPIVWFYVLAAGAQPSAIRAAAMFSLLSFGVIMRRRSNNLNELFATAFLLLCAEPAWVLSIGFQLSFVAVLSIIVFFRPVYNLLPLQRKKTTVKGVRGFLLQRITDLPRKLWTAIAVSISAEMLVAPLVIYYFHSFPVMFILANVAAYVFMSFVLMQGMVLLTLGGIAPIGYVVSHAIMKLTDLFSSLVAWLQDMGPVVFRHISLSLSETIILYVVVACVAWFLLRRHKPAIYGSLAALCLLLLMISIRQWGDYSRRRLVIYNIPRSYHAELEEGTAYAVLCTDTSRADDIAFITAPEHTAGTAWMPVAHAPAQELVYINGRSLLFINSDSMATEPFPVNYLILNHPRATDIERLAALHQPSAIVITNRYRHSQAARITAVCRDRGIAVHNIATDGAFIFPQ